MTYLANLDSVQKDFPQSFWAHWHYRSIGDPTHRDAVLKVNKHYVVRKCLLPDIDYCEMRYGTLNGTFYCVEFSYATLITHGSSRYALSEVSGRKKRVLYRPDGPWHYGIPTIELLPITRYDLRKIITTSALKDL